MLTQVFTPYQGRIVELFAKVGDEVKKGQALFTIDSPDLVQASSTLISSAAVLELTTRSLERMRMLYGPAPPHRRIFSTPLPTIGPPSAPTPRPATLCAPSARPTPRW